jgi:hypothetical protein
MTNEPAHDPMALIQAYEDTHPGLFDKIAMVTIDGVADRITSGPWVLASVVTPDGPMILRMTQEVATDLGNQLL